MGSLRCIAAQLNDGLLKLLNNQTERAAIFIRFLKELQGISIPNILIIEDIHWADESTLDLIKYLGRRANRINSLFLITYRDDELSPRHPLRFVLGDIASKSLKKFKLSSLTEKTVNKLANLHGIKNLFQITSGNPFLINELINNKNEIIPSAIKDSILTRISRLTDDARDLAELVSIIPSRAEKWILNEITQNKLKKLDECLNAGILKTEAEFISFKHELSRMAVEESLSDSKRQLLNRRVLNTLLNQEKTEDYLARIIHHASVINNKEIIIKYSPAAARQASDLGAHRLAANHYLNAVKFADDLTLEKQLELYNGRVYECYLTGQVDEGIKACELMLEILKSFPDPRIEGEVYRRLANLFWFDSHDAKSIEYLCKAVEILEKQQLTKELAMTYSNLSQIYAHRNKSEEAVKYGEKAIVLAKSVNDLETEAHSLNNIGLCKMRDNEDSGEWYLKQSLELSLKNNFYEHTARAYCNLGAKYLWGGNLMEAFKYLAIGLEYCYEKGLDAIGEIIAGDYAKAKLNYGDWEGAIELSDFIYKKINVPTVNKIFPLCVIAQIRTRRIDPGALKLLDEADYLALKLGEIDRIVTVKGARAEYFWLQNNLSNVVDELEEVYKTLLISKDIWAIGEIAYWLWKAGKLNEIPEKIAKPYLLQIKGKWKDAADVWKELHHPYEQALALSEGNEESMKCAIEILEQLGATATSQLIKQKMRESGIRNIPKGPRKIYKAESCRFNYQTIGNIRSPWERFKQ